MREGKICQGLNILCSDLFKNLVATLHFALIWTHTYFTQLLSYPVICQTEEQTDIRLPSDAFEFFLFAQASLFLTFQS